MATKIDNNNAESIGRPIVEKALRLFEQANHVQFLTHFPDLTALKEQQKFNTAVENLRFLGDTPSIDYLDQLTKPDMHLLWWKVRSKDSDKALLLGLGLNEAEDVIVLVVKKPNKTVSVDTRGKPISLEMNSNNAESLGFPIIETLLKSLLSSDFDLYCQILTDSNHKESADTLEIFNEAVGVLQPMGNMISIKYLAHTKMATLHTLIWKVQYQKEDEDLLFELMLTDHPDGIKVKGWAFDR